MASITQHYCFYYYFIVVRLLMEYEMAQQHLPILLPTVQTVFEFCHSMGDGNKLCE
jgi:hypothetical protein